MAKNYSYNVFINCPFDEVYSPIHDAIIFAILDCEFIPRSAREENDSGDVRFEKIKRLISESKFGIHDMSRIELDDTTHLPRFNMPLELGVFIGAKKFGDELQKKKNALILDREPYRYQTFISDISGQDIRSHKNDPAQAISHIRDWLNAASGLKTIPGGKIINARYQQFQSELPALCKQIQLEVDEVTYNDYCILISKWLKSAN